MTGIRYAEDAPYWDTTVQPMKSQGEISQMLEDFGASAVMIAIGKTKGKTAWLVRFSWLGRSYRFVFTPLICRFPLKVWVVAGKKLEGQERARYQMGRIAVHFVKAILTAAEMNHDALFGFVEVSANGTTMTAAELDVEGILEQIPAIQVYRLGNGEEL